MASQCTYLAYVSIKTSLMNHKPSKSSVFTKTLSSLPVSHLPSYTISHDHPCTLVLTSYPNTLSKGKERKGKERVTYSTHTNTAHITCLLISTLTQPLIISYFLVLCSSVYTTGIPLPLLLYVCLSVRHKWNSKKKKKLAYT